MGFVARDELFAALDGRELEVDKRCWRIELYGISDVCGQRWIQLGLTGQKRLSLTMKLAIGDGEQRALLLLSEWLTAPSKVTEVLNVV